MTMETCSIVILPHFQCLDSFLFFFLTSKYCRYSIFKRKLGSGFIPESFPLMTTGKVEYAWGRLVTLAGYLAAQLQNITEFAHSKNILFIRRCHSFYSFSPLCLVKHSVFHCWSPLSNFRKQNQQGGLLVKCLYQIFQASAPPCSSENFSRFAFLHNFDLTDKLLTLSIFKEFEKTENERNVKAK